MGFRIQDIVVEIPLPGGRALKLSVPDLAFVAVLGLVLVVVPPLFMELDQGTVRLLRVVGLLLTIVAVATMVIVYLRGPSSRA